MAISIPEFKKTVWRHYRQCGRHDLPWRKTSVIYRILVSEMMLQQTQVERVIPKYRAFLKLFPTLSALANASLASVVGAWQGLGYNRRAAYLHRLARVVVADFAGRFPKDYDHQRTLPGIGPYTAAALQVFALNRSMPMIETNIRRVYLHHFFTNGRSVPDAHLVPIIEQTIDPRRPREWFWALMDYGSHLGRQPENANRRSRHYTRQSTFTGSRRQARGALLTLLVDRQRMKPSDAIDILARKSIEPALVREAMEQLIREGVIVRTDRVISIRSA